MTREEFNALYPEEIQAIPEKEWVKLPSCVKRSCDGCGHLKLIKGISYFCNNPYAAEAYGTAFHKGTIKCRWWMPKEYHWAKVLRLK